MEIVTGILPSPTRTSRTRSRISKRRSANSSRCRASNMNMYRSFSYSRKMPPTDSAQLLSTVSTSPAIVRYCS